MTTHRFALVLSGAVSLGTYEAGVLTQLYRDFEELNAITSGHARLVIDAIAGASAGAVTGLILARALAYHESSAQVEERMRACWVDGLDILSLLDPAADPAEALFTEASIDQVSSRVLPKVSQEGAVREEDVIALWIALTNLDGIPYEIRFARCRVPAAISFYPRSYRDYSPFFVCGSNIRFVSVPIEQIEHTTWAACRGATWDEARDSAVASAAFPLAFRSRVLERDPALYPQYTQRFLSDPRIQQWLTRAGLASAQQQSPRFFHYVDGGVFNNEPIGRAIDAASYLSCLDPRRAGDPRTYLVIEPDPSTRGMEAVETGIPPAQSHGLAPIRVLGEIEQAYFSDTLYRDFEEAAKTNEWLRALDAVAQRWRLNTDQVQELKVAVGLGHKEIICLERVPIDIPQPGAPRLAGAVVGHFGGFLDRAFREHDFAVGQCEAREWLTRWLPAYYDALGLTQVERNATQAYLAEATPLPPPVPALQAVLESRGRDIVRCGLDRVEALAERWLPIPTPLVKPLRILFEPIVRAFIPGVAEARPDWLGALRAFSQNALGRSVAAKVGLGLSVFAALLTGLTWFAGQLALQFGPWAGAIPGASFGVLTFLVALVAYVASRKTTA